jgi:hypothetical protein
MRAWTTLRQTCCVCLRTPRCTTCPSRKSTRTPWHCRCRPRWDGAAPHPTAWLTRRVCLQRLFRQLMKDVRAAAPATGGVAAAPVLASSLADRVHVESLEVKGVTYTVGTRTRRVARGGPRLILPGAGAGDFVYLNETTPLGRLTLVQVHRLWLEPPAYVCASHPRALARPRLTAPTTHPGRRRRRQSRGCM